MRGCTARWLAVALAMLLLLHSCLSAVVTDAASMERCSCCLHSYYDNGRQQPPLVLPEHSCRCALCCPACAEASSHLIFWAPAAARTARQPLRSLAAAAINVAIQALQLHRAVIAHPMQSVLSIDERHANRHDTT